MKVLAIIPARKGSKGLSGKNTRLCAGKPLIQWTIEAATQSWLVTDIVVITDSDEIARLAKQQGIYVVDEPADLAEGKSLSDFSKALLYAYNSFTRQNNDKIPDIVILLQPTSPLRTGRDIDKAVVQFLNRPTARTLRSVYPQSRTQWVARVDDCGFLQYLLDVKWETRENCPPFYVPNGAIIGARKTEFLADPLFRLEPTVPFVMATENSVDIDNFFDLEMAEWLLLRRKTMDNSRFDNIHAGQRAWIVSPGPSLKDVTDEQWKKAHAIIAYDRLRYDEALISKLSS